jgi:hypothetical protein
VLYLIDEIINIWRVEDRRRVENSEDEEEISRLQNLRQMLTGIFDSKSWSSIEALLIRVLQCEEESISDAAEHLIETIVRWLDKFDVHSQEPNELPQIARAFANVTRQIGGDAPPGPKRNLLRARQTQLQKYFSEWLNTDRTSAKFRLSRMIRIAMQTPS